MADWREETVARVRELTEEAIPDVVEESKWQKASSPDGIPVFYKDGILFTAETYKAKVKLTFYKGASLEDPDGVFNGDDKGKTRRSIDIAEGDELDADAFKALVKAAAEHNAA